MSTAGGPKIVSDGLVFALDAASSKMSKAGCAGFSSAEQLIKNLASTGDTVTSTSDLRLGNLTFYTIYSQTYPESDNNPSGASGTRDGITPGFNNVTSSELLDFSRDMNYAVWDNATNSWVADSYFNGTRLSGHCYDTYSSTTRAEEHAQFQSDYEAIVEAFPDATHIVCGSHAADHNDLDSDTLAILKGLGGPSSWPTGRPEYILIGKPGLGADNAYVWQYENDTTGRAHANVGLPILGGKKRGGNYLEFDGSDDFVTTSFGSGRNPYSSPTTFVAWVKSDTTTANKMWLDHGSNGTNQRLYSALITADNPAPFGIQSSAWGLPSSADTSKWYHQALVMDSGTARGYYDGIAAGTKSYTSYTLPGATRAGGRSSYLWDGKIACFAIYDKALSATEIKQNFNSQRRRFGV